jgi:hypothetical protein
MRNTKLIITFIEENVCTKHVCIAINDGCEVKYIWTWMNVDKCEWNLNKWNSSTIIKHHSFVPILHSLTFII